jgi:hypothetical protein
MKYFYKTFVSNFHIIILLLCLSLSSCKSTLDVHGNFPTPIINQMPLSVGLVLIPDFSNYTYIEAGEDRDEWEISLGDAQVQLFNVILDAMFSDVLQANNINQQTSSSVDLFLQPQLDSFQYNMPYETKGKMFEVWLKYNIKIFDNQQTLIADWILTAYGKTPTAFLQSKEDALNQAMVIALRDLGASMSLRFTQVPEINQWLQMKRHSLQAKLGN